MNKNKNLKILSFIMFTLVSILLFFFIWNIINYRVHYEVKRNTVNHPEFIPSYKMAKITSAWFENIVADFYWLDSIQYIWSNAATSKYKVYLYSMLDLITDLNPNFSFPYQIWELLLASYNEKYEQSWINEQDKYDKQALNIWLKWIKNLCDTNKIEAIKKEPNIEKIWSDNKYSNPCVDSNIPYYLAYIYYWNYHDWLKSSEYYKITSANKDAPTWSRIMSAIMQWKWWNRETSILMFLSLAESLWNKNTQVCKDFSTELRNLLLKIHGTNLQLSEEMVKNVELTRKAIEKTWSWKVDESLTNESDCIRYLDKAVREINLQFLENADIRFFNDNKRHAVQWRELLEKWYIKYLPVDYQYSKDLPVIYIYNKETGHWDNKVSDMYWE